MRGSDGGMTLKVGRFKGRLRHPINPNIAPEARYIGVHFTLINTSSLFLGERIEARYIEGPGKSGHGISGFYCISIDD